MHVNYEIECEELGFVRKIDVVQTCTKPKIFEEISEAVDMYK